MHSLLFSDHNVISLMEFLIKIQRMFDSTQLINVQVLYHGEFGGDDGENMSHNMSLVIRKPVFGISDKV